MKPLLVLIHIVLSICQTFPEIQNSCEINSVSVGVANDYLSLFRDVLLNYHYNYFSEIIDGSKHPPDARAMAMTGQRRLDNFAILVSQVIYDNIEGHIIETGVWRGGSTFLAAKVVELLHQDHIRKIYLCDSFTGIPTIPNDGKKYDIYDQQAHRLTILNNNNIEQVINDAKKLRLNISNLEFIVGYFNDTLPQLIQKDPTIQFSVIRLDGDTYFSTMDAISILYPHLTEGGFIIIDDYMDWPGCRTAIHDYRILYNITEPMIVVPHGPNEMARGIYWRKQPSSSYSSTTTTTKTTTSATTSSSTTTTITTTTTSMIEYNSCVGQHVMKPFDALAPSTLVNITAMPYRIVVFGFDGLHNLKICV